MLLEKVPKELWMSTLKRKKIQNPVCCEYMFFLHMQVTASWVYWLKI